MKIKFAKVFEVNDGTDDTQVLITKDFDPNRGFLLVMETPVNGRMRQMAGTYMTLEAMEGMFERYSQEDAIEFRRGVVAYYGSIENTAGMPSDAGNPVNSSSIIQTP
jgi:hypothetical protein